VIVADANLLVYYMLDGEFTQQAEAVRKADPRWIAPRIVRLEFLQILGKYMARGALTRDEAVRFYRRARASLKEYSSEADHLSVLALMEQHKCSAYDAECVLLAQSRNIQLVTGDKALQKAFPETAVSIEGFLKS